MMPLTDAKDTVKEFACVCLGLPMELWVAKDVLLVVTGILSSELPLLKAFPEGRPGAAESLTV